MKTLQETKNKIIKVKLKDYLQFLSENQHTMQNYNYIEKVIELVEELDD